MDGVDGIAMRTIDGMDAKEGLAELLRGESKVAGVLNYQKGVTSWVVEGAQVFEVSRVIGGKKESGDDP